MKRILYMLVLLPSLVFGFGATNLYQIPGNTNMGYTRDGIQSNFQALVPYPGTNMTVEYTPTGVVFSTSPGSSVNLLALSNGVINVGLEATNAGLGVTQVGLAATNAGLGVTQVGIAATNAASMASWKGTNLLPLAFGAGNTATVLRSDVLLKRPFRVDVTSTPASITFEGSWPTNEIADAFLSIQKGTNSLTLVGATIMDSGRASSTNVFASSTNRTGVMFHKELGESKFYSIQMVP